MSFPSPQLTASSDVRMRKVLTIPMARFARNVRFGPAAIALPVKPFTDPQCVSTRDAPNKSLDASGASVLRNYIGSAAGALIPAAAPTPPVGKAAGSKSAATTYEGSVMTTNGTTTMLNHV